MRAPLAPRSVNDLRVDDDQILRAEIHTTKGKGTNGKERKRVTQQESTLEPAMDWFINADVRPGVGCRRKVVNIFFDNEAAESDHRSCNTLSPDGCPRCVVPTSDICCDIHSPDFFAPYSVVIPPQSKRPSRSRISGFTMSSDDLALVNALEDWREGTTISLHGEGFLCDLGPGLVMPTKVLDRIVTCAHAHKIKTVANLQKETSWSGAEHYGHQIVSLVLQHLPIPVIAPLFTSAPLPRSNGVAPSPLTTLAPKPTTRRQIRCSACHGEGHNARNRDCPSHPSRRPTDTHNKENAGQLALQ
ncbi:hypothetical protein L210DRAFT_3495955 [Boletus edulis BED1]|uniref:Uncharacterized protein n=1 Tax=Boletus edulis BED1 TaxID=1328754 RepID=A0AAD4BB57_BOLED|nr:hypothetical protein L210DRAFT_3495955 [Boletus edulis BED1]